MEKKVRISNYFMLAIILVLTVCYINYGGLLIKSLTSISFVITGSINAIYVKNTNPSKFKIAFLMLIGMYLGMCGDVFINLEFVPGAIAFAFGHIFYWIVHIKRDAVCKKDIVAAIILTSATAAFLFLTPIFDFGSIVFSVVIFVYCIIISNMASKAIMNLTRKKSCVNKCWAVGSILFFFSDEPKGNVEKGRLHPSSA